MPKRIIEQKDIAAAAGATVIIDAFSSTNVEKRKLIEFGVTTNTADVDLLIYHQRELIVDIPSDDQLLTAAHCPFELEVPEKEVISVGCRNGTGGAVTLTVILVQEIM